jgi:SAM-dependent methyltransferase
MTRRLVSRLKSRLLPAGVGPRYVPLGLYRGLTLELDLQTQSQTYLGLAERETHGHLQRALETCRWVVDVGAGSGELSVLFLRHSGAEQVFAIEPGRLEAGVIVRNLALNGCTQDRRCQVIDKFAGDVDGPDSVALDSLPIDQTKKGFIKIDVDGAEVAVLRGAARLLQGAVVDLLVEVHSAELEREVIDLLVAHGYGCTVIPNGWWRLVVPEQRPIPHNRWLWAAKVPGRPEA